MFLGQWWYKTPQALAHTAVRNVSASLLKIGLGGQFCPIDSFLCGGSVYRDHPCRLVIS